LGVESTLIRGSGGVFEVAVNGEVVAKKTLDGFPLSQDIVAAVRKKLGP
jgi:predicted Rdx family selenoprotein